MSLVLPNSESGTQPSRFAIIAGNGRFPFLVLEGAKEQQIDPLIIAIREEASPELSQKSKRVHWLSLGEIARLMELLRTERIEKVMLAGQVKHAQLYSSIPADSVTSGTLHSLERKNTDALIGAFVKMLEAQGIEVVDSTLFIEPMLAPEGLVSGRELDAEERADVEYGREVAKALAGLDIGQTVVVADRACVALEAMEGTDAAIERAAALSNGRRLVVVKVSKPAQDMRFDVPVIGPKTMEVMRRSNGRVLAVDAGKTLLFERNQLLRSAAEAGISIIGMP